jgi:hypothetical protein
MQPDLLKSFQEAIATLDQSAESLDNQLESARTARPADRATLTAFVDELLQAGRAVREQLASLAVAAAELRARAKIMSSTFLFGSYGVVPFPMKVCGFYVELGHLFVSDFDSGFVFAIIDGGFHDEPFGSACGRY